MPEYHKWVSSGKSQNIVHQAEVKHQLNDILILINLLQTQ